MFIMVSSGAFIMAGSGSVDCSGFFFSVLRLRPKKKSIVLLHFTFVALTALEV
jgi:hypothetical protein